MTNAIDVEGLKALVKRRMRHDGLCGIVGGYGYCTCGMDADKAALLAHIAGEDGRVEAAVGWQDIASAPKDGSEIDLWGSHPHETPARVTDCKWMHDANGPGWNARGDRGWESLCAVLWRPTHWMPRPTIPASLRESAR